MKKSTKKNLANAARATGRGAAAAGVIGLFAAAAAADIAAANQAATSPEARRLRDAQREAEAAARAYEQRFPGYSPRPVTSVKPAKATLTQDTLIAQTVQDAERDIAGVYGRESRIAVYASVLESFCVRAAGLDTEWDGELTDRVPFDSSIRRGNQSVASGVTLFTADPYASGIHFRIRLERSLRTIWAATR